MKLAYLLVICMISTTFTGCIDDLDSDVVEDIDDSKDNTNADDDKNNTTDDKNDTIDEIDNNIGQSEYLTTGQSEYLGSLLSDRSRSSPILSEYDSCGSLEIDLKEHLKEEMRVTLGTSSYYYGGWGIIDDVVMVEEADMVMDSA